MLKVSTDKTFGCAEAVARTFEGFTKARSRESFRNQAEALLRPWSRVRPCSFRLWHAGALGATERNGKMRCARLNCM